MVSFFAKLFGRKKTIERPAYKQPELTCSSLILLSGPTYGDKTFFGSFLLDAVAVRAWVLDHSKSVWSSASLEQQAREFLPVWLEQATYEENDYVTLIDMPMRQVLVPYIYDFYSKGWLSIYCHECKEMHDSLVDNQHGVERIGRTSKWTEEWLCPAGHIVHHKDEEIRLIVRNSSKSV